ncbi:MAG: hypothetical protein HY422_01200 [Candidatus Komeilibacteria bacterium]|nr:hypothetical protein [Candidatus Komeilibacteria bacterium]
MQTLETKTKTFATIIAIAGIIVLGYGGYGIMQSIRTPFNLNSITPDQLLALIPQTQEQQQAGQRTSDTDGDTLNDYDEINLYGTSPYLADSDSDGLSDDAEVKAGSDPNCAKGQDCQGIRLVTPDTKISDLFPQFSGSDITLKDKTMQEFRQILLDQGFDKQKLDALDDETLLIILEESLKLQDQGTATSTPVEPGEPDLEQVRHLLISLGVPEEEVNSMSNQDVEDILRTLK